VRSKESGWRRSKRYHPAFQRRPNSPAISTEIETAAPGESGPGSQNGCGVCVEHQSDFLPRQAQTGCLGVSEIFSEDQVVPAFFE
jgi:hypothetical protein